MGDIKTTYESADLGHHVRQGLAWLENSEGGRNTAALSYAAFDLRLGVERLAMQYWLDALGRNVVDNDVRTIWKFDRIEKAIYDLVGHQLEIDRTFEFMRVAMAALKIDAEMVTPRIGDLRTAWDNCSELCHIGGVLGLSDPACTRWHMRR